MWMLSNRVLGIVPFLPLEINCLFGSGSVSVSWERSEWLILVGTFIGVSGICGRSMMVMAWVFTTIMPTY